jgi:hypothetical protein
VENCRPKNFAISRTQKKVMRFVFHLKKDEEMEGKLNDAGLDAVDNKNKQE